jgi:hypothetical protein
MHDKAGHHRKRALGSSVDRRRMTGVGCIGKPASLINMLHRLMAQYERGAGRTNALREYPSPVNCAACHLMNRLTLEFRKADVVSPSSDEQRKRVAGFFIYLDHDRARISVFTRNEVIPPLRLA